MNYPESISFTITNACNLRCQMCAQWSREGYMHENKQRLRNEMGLADWMNVVDQLSDHRIKSILIRGGEPFLYPQIIELLQYIHSKGIFVAIDTNGTMLERFAEEIVRIGDIHLTVSVDGPPEIHDAVRGVKGTFDRVEAGLHSLQSEQMKQGRKISLGICFTISQYSYKGLAEMPAIARRLGIDTIAIVPYYYFPESVGEAYDRLLNDRFGCLAYSWRGFHHESSGIEWDEFRCQYHRYLDTLENIYNYPYLPLEEDQYQTWFEDPVSPVGESHCWNVERLIDIQPNGDANFCVDFPDYVFGNVRENTIAEIWNSERAEDYRQLRRQGPLPICFRCGSKYMSAQEEES
jgi:MoaA/NifB/PqqE/SkfB family radical SAM enzyme